jgi:hypothetical protein
MHVQLEEGRFGDEGLRGYKAARRRAQTLSDERVLVHCPSCASTVLLSKLLDLKNMKKSVPLAATARMLRSPTAESRHLPP